MCHAGLPDVSANSRLKRVKSSPNLSRSIFQSGSMKSTRKCPLPPPACGDSYFCWYQQVWNYYDFSGVARNLRQGCVRSFFLIQSAVFLCTGLNNSESGTKITHFPDRGAYVPTHPVCLRHCMIFSKYRIVSSYKWWFHAAYGISFLGPRIYDTGRVVFY